MVRLPAQTGCAFFTTDTAIAESNLVEVYKDGLNVSLGNEQFTDSVIAIKYEQAEVVS